VVPYREEPNALVVLDKLDARPVHPVRALGSLLIRARPDRSGPPAEHCPPDVAASARQLKLEHLGALSEAGRTREVWVDETRTLQLHSSPTLRFFSTYFEDGSCVLTFQSANPVTMSTPNLRVCGGAGTVEADFDAHGKSVAEWTSTRGCAPIRVDNIVMAARLVRFYYRHVVAPANMASIVVFLVFLIALVIVVAYRLLVR